MQQDRISGNIIERKEEYIVPKQSANTLFRFFKKPEYLFESIKRKALVPRYYGEKVGYLDIGHRQISYPMICFCDIAMHRLEEHMRVYGEYGIAFAKSWGISRGIQPIQYINKNSVLKEDFMAAFASAMATEYDSPAANFLLTEMFYMKPIEGEMPQDDDVIFKNFTDECEWRYIPDVRAIDLPQVVAEEEIASIGKLNATIEENNVCWLDFDFSDVKYIIIPNEDSFGELCDMIDHIVGESEETRRKLISKIILWSDAKEDF